jgi:hypothetical protein
MTADHPTRSPDSPDPDGGRRMECPECGRVATVPPWCKRPICVHDWTGNAPEIWDGDDVDGRGGYYPIEASQNADWRTPGPNTWALMVPPPLSDSVRTPDLDVERLARAFTLVQPALYGEDWPRDDPDDFQFVNPRQHAERIAAEYRAALHPASPPREGEK